MYAIVVTGGKQYKVAVDDIIEVEKLSVEPGATVELEVAFIADGSKIVTNADELAQAKVFATVVEQFKGSKQIIFKFKKRKGYKRLRGHRQELTRLQIVAVSLDGKPPKKETPKKAAKKKEAAEAEVLDTKAADAPLEAAAEEKPAKKTTRKKKAEQEEPIDAPAATDDAAPAAAEAEAKDDAAPALDALDTNEKPAEDTAPATDDE